MPLPQSPPHGLLCPGREEGGRNHPFQHSFSRPVSLLPYLLSPCPMELTPWASSCGSKLGESSIVTQRMSVWVLVAVCLKLSQASEEREEGERFVMSSQHQACVQGAGCMHKSEQSAQHYFRWMSTYTEVTEVNQKSGAFFPTPSTPHPTLESPLLSSNHLVCDRVTGVLTVTSGRGQRKLLNSSWHESNMSCFLTYICVHICFTHIYVKTRQRTAAHPTLLQSACYG